MTDQDRREGATEGQVLDEIIDTAQASAAQAAANDEARPSEPAAQPTPETEAGAAAELAPAAEGETTSAPTDEAAEPVTMEQADEAAEPVAAEPTAEAAEPVTTEQADEAAEPVAAEQAAEAAEPVTTEQADEAAEPVAAEQAAEAAEPVTTEQADEAAEPVAAEQAAEAAEAAEADTTSETAAAEAAGASFTPVEEEERRPRRMKDLAVGMELEGRITSIALYGVFVDIGVGRDGLVHISEMSESRIDTPSDIVQIGDIVKVWVKSLDVDARRISLTMRAPGERSERRSARPKRNDVDREALARLVELLETDKANATVEGTITGYAPFGAFADIGVGKDGLIHISELSENRVERPEEAVQVGDRYTFKLLEVDPEGTRISLSLRRAQRTQKMQQLEPGQILDGAVSGMATFGAFVDIGVGRDGLVHISELAEGRVEKVEDVVKVGDKVQVRVLEVDPQSKRISLTMRLEDRPAPETEEYSDERTTPSNVVPRTGPGAAARFAGVTANREEGRRDRDDRRRGRGKPGAAQPQTAEVYTAGGDDEEEFEGNATLEDLLSKFGSSPSNRRERSRTRREDDEEDREERQNRRQRDMIRRTLQQVGGDDAESSD